MVTTLFGNNLRRVIFLLMVGVFVSMGGAFAAPPVNDTCDNALVVTPGSSGQTNNTEATFAPDDPELSCTMGPGFGSVFFEFVATETSARVRTDVDSVGLDSDFAVYAVDQNNPCDKSLWTEVGCSEDGSFEFNGDICIEGLTVGDTYKIMLVSFTEGSSGEYTLQIDSPCQGQASGDAVPVVSNTTAIPNPVEIEFPVTITADIFDSDSNVSSAEYNINGETWSTMVISGTGVTVAASIDIPGGFINSEVLTVCVRGTDAAGNISDEECIYLPVYDPSAGFVTGGGWIDSPEGAYVVDPSAVGKANFGFVSKYKKGTTVPDGNTEFQFKAAGLDFHSSEYEWLVVTGSNYAKFKGSGTINGEGSYKFMIWAGDGDTDTFRIKIWEEDEDEDENETVTYDNGFDQAIGGGSIVIHTGGKGKN